MKLALIGLAVLPLVLTARPTLAASDTLVPQAPIEVPGGPAHFDFMNFDSDMHRVLACHPGAKQLVVLDLKSSQVTSIDTGAVNGVAIDGPDNRYYAAGPDNEVVVIDRTSLQKVADIPTTGPGDDIIYDPTNALVYVDNDDGTLVWVIDPKTNAITTSITVAGAPEVVAYDSVTNRLYQNIKPANEVQVIDPATDAVVATWPTAPATSPHGLAIDSKRGRVYTAGKNGKLVAIDVKTGQLLGSCDIAAKVDQVVYDPKTDRIYCACSAGAVSVVVPTRHGIKNVADVTVPKGTHTLAVDPDGKDVWIAYSDDKGSYLEDLKPSGN
ncbi:MAG: YncE family protein [Capsulimonadaceae bacterium]